MRYSFSIPHDLEVRLKILAAKTGRTLQSIGADATESYVAEQEKKLTEFEAARDTKKPEAVAA